MKSLEFEMVPVNLRTRLTTRSSGDHSVHYALLTTSEHGLQATFRQRARLHWTLSSWAEDFNQLLKPKPPLRFALSTTILLSSSSESGSSEVGLVYELPPGVDQSGGEIPNVGRAFQLFVLLQTDGAAACTAPLYLGAGIWKQPELVFEDEGSDSIRRILKELALTPDVSAPPPKVASADMGLWDEESKTMHEEAGAAGSRRETTSGVNLLNLPKRSSLLLQRHPSSAVLPRGAYEV